jgi:ubiquinone/menaquinone biosynthesis C-methylase UbiE
MAAIDYSTITEVAGDEISQEQLERLCHRYYWAATYSAGKDVIEAACGTGPGLGYLATRVRSLRAGDFTTSILAVAQEHYGDRIDLRQFDAQAMPFADDSADIVILFEAIYYIPSVQRFLDECRRVLRVGGQVLIATANKDLYDFNPSPHSHTYFGVVELHRLFSENGFAAECFGYLSTRDVSARQRVLRPVKKLAVGLKLMPQTSEGKKWLKRFVFGSMIRMPVEIEEDMISYTPPAPLSPSSPDREHKVIYCVAKLLDQITRQRFANL